MNAPALGWHGSRVDTAVAAIERDGYCILRRAADPAQVCAIAADFAPRFERMGRCDGPFFGRNTKRFHALLTRSGHSADFVLNRLVLEIVDRLLLPYCDRVQLNLTQAIEILPGERAQAPHRDQDMWQRPVPGIEYLVNVMWPLGAFTAANGATRMWPGTHRQLDVKRPPLEEAVAAEMEPGDALLYLGSVVHGGGANVSAGPRRGMVVSYALGWLKQFENMSLTYPPAVARTFPPKLADLIGYRCHVGTLGNFDGRCPSSLLSGDYDELEGAREVMPPQHAAVLEHFAAAQAWP
jgi:ectoine hydroxylase-related dioxygenase (phytanoyl-CoA dioxygenase family)